MMKHSVIAFLVGALVAAAIPSSVAISTSGEVVSFVSLLMAGLLPAMILTATVLRGDRFAASRVRNYGVALRKQLAFWALLFAMALLAVFAMTAAKTLSGLLVWETTLAQIPVELPGEGLKRFAVMLSYGAVAVILAKLWSAYLGLQSLLGLSVQMAELQALANDRSLKDDLDAKSERLSGAPEPERSEWPRV